MELNESSESSAEVLDENLNISTKILNDYEVVSVIGNGSFGTCFKVREKATGNFFAWKGIDYDEFSDSQRELLISEIRVLRQLQHPNIVQYYNHLINPEAKSLFIVMEYCEGGDLAQWIAKARVERKRFEELYIWRILYQICRALQICHNKIKDGTILHRDIKPANIFLDANGNAKLGDFGLARMLRRNETFAETFVGTPYYMSPEIVKGNKYDRKSDVWAVGCLIYEMCALCPPFKGREFSQLSTNIKIGKYNKISSVYSENLQNIIKFMLEVENDQRPSIEIILRHPIVVSNIHNLGDSLPCLVDVANNEIDFYMLINELEVQRKLDFSSIRDSSHIHLIKRKSLDDKSYGKGLNIAGMLTPDLRAEIFYSTKREIYAMAPKLQHSDPELYESIKHETLDPRREQRNSFKKNNTLETKPELLTKEVFGDALKVRLHAIRAQESLLRQKEESLDIREKQLNEKECRLLQLEDNLLEKSRLLFKEMEKLSLANNSFSNANILSSQLENAATLDMPPPLPPRKSTLHDETYCSIESNEVTLLHEPTMAKLDLNTLPAPKAFSNTRARKVTFQSPKNFIRYDIENNAIKKQQKMQTSVSSKGSEGSSEGTNSVNCPKQRRKSLFSILGFNRNNKENIDAMSKSNPSHSPHKKVLKNAITTIKEQISISEEKILSKCETAELSNIWTKDHKRAAFEMLAVMNGANVSHSNTSRHKLRHSARERNILHHNRLRRSFMAPM